MKIRLHMDKISIQKKVWLKAGDYPVVRALGFGRWIIRTNVVNDYGGEITIIHIERDHGEIIYAD